MIVPVMTTKRQRRPNVRLGEIGDASASFSVRGFLRPQLDTRSWEIKPEKFSECNGPESARVASDTQNWENRNPNSKEYDVGLEESDRRNPRFGFGMVNRKRRLKKRPRWSLSNLGISTSWHSRVSPEFGNDTERAHESTNWDSVKTDCSHSDHDTWNWNRDNDNDNDGYGGSSDGSLPENSWKHENNLLSDGGHYSSDKADVSKKPWTASATVNSVKEWLTELGFGRYAGLFEMHEVDMDVLPLLTYEDLKEMGIATDGTRRRMYSAIRKLNKGSDTA